MNEKQLKTYLTRKYGARVVQIFNSGYVVASGLDHANAVALAAEMGTDAQLSRPLGILGGYAVKFQYYDGKE